MASKVNQFKLTMLKNTALNINQYSKIFYTRVEPLACYMKNCQIITNGVGILQNLFEFKNVEQGSRAH